MGKTQLNQTIEVLMPWLKVMGMINEPAVLQLLSKGGKIQKRAICLDRWSSQRNKGGTNSLLQDRETKRFIMTFIKQSLYTNSNQKFDG